MVKALDAPNQLIATIKQKGAKFVEKIKSRTDVTIFILQPDNKEKLLGDILSEAD